MEEYEEDNARAVKSNKKPILFIKINYFSREH